MNARATTAELVAATRARHQRNRVRLVDDPYALALCGWPLRLLVNIRPAAWVAERTVLRKLGPTMMSVLMRARYSEHALEAAVDAGMSQYVILGAGLDSFALRRADLMERLRVFEIDLPAMQAVKRKRLRRAGIEPPAGLHFVAADLSRTPIMEALTRESAFDVGQPAFFSLLGLTYYLTEEVLAATARSIAAGVAAGSEIVLDHLLDDASSWPEHRAKRAAMEAYVAKRGEPMVSDFSLANMSALMAEAGFDAVDGVTMMDLGERYARELGSLPFEIPGMFGCGLFRKPAPATEAAT